MVTGGQYDVDVVLEGPNQEILYQQTRSQFDSHQFTADVSIFGSFFTGSANNLINFLSSSPMEYTPCALAMNFLHFHIK